MKRAWIAAAVAAVSLTQASAQGGEATLLFLRTDPSPPDIKELGRAGISDEAIRILARADLTSMASMGTGTLTYRSFDNPQCEGRSTSLARLRTETKNDWKSVKTPAGAPIYIQSVGNRVDQTSSRGNRQAICITVTGLVPEPGRTYRIFPAGDCGIFAYDEQTRAAAPGLRTYPVDGQCEHW